MQNETDELFNKFLTLKISINEIPTQKLIVPAIFAELIFTKKIYRKNNELSELTKDILHLEYKNYLFKSRTLLFSRVIKDKYINPSDKEMFSLMVALQKLIGQQEKYHVEVDNKEETSVSKNKKTKSQKHIISEWRKVIKSDD